ncbi:Cna B-type domain-containing protein, partial [Peptoniphilus mikwangii]|uniref:Cna B-type domain-containing protein n=1 Tax=Peptoniphilus mikwangii TaxID=1354300 RepID=UPI000563D43C
DYTTQINGYNVTNNHTPEETSVKVTKKWDDANNQDGKRPNSIKVQLYADDKKVGDAVELNDGNSWTYTWEKLPKNAAGKPIAYTVKEVGTVDGYTTSYGNDSQGNVIITNKHTPEKVKVEGEKTWDDAEDQDGKRPKEIIVNLLANGNKIKEVKVTKDDNWKYSFTDLPKYENGQEIKYTVTENVVSEYKTEITGYNIKNSYTPGKTSVTVTKNWDDANNQDGKRPESIKVQLYGDDKKVGDEVELKKETGWTYTWNDLPEKKAGKTIKYTVKEVGEINGYITSYDDANHGNIIITNKHTPEKVKVEGEKTWDDNNDQDGKRPTTITVKLLKKVGGGAPVVVQTKQVSKGDDGKWKYEFNDLPKYENGKEIIYSIKEEPVDGYETEINGYNITNKHKPEKVEVEGEKTWNDNNNQDGKRPTKIIIKLLKKVGNEAAVIKETKEVTEGADHKWKWKFENLDKYENGKLITYSIEEEKVDGYETEINNYDVTNSHTPEKINIEGAKTWDDANNQDGKRPTEIIINLLKNGTKIDSKKVTKADGWKWKFENLDKYENGQEITYTITEEKVEGYSTTVKGYNVKNSYTPGKTSIQVTKVWRDNNDQDGVRPDSVIIQLLADGVEVPGKTLTLTKANNWTGSFTNLDEYKDGKKIKYTIREVAIGNGYVSVITGTAEEGYVVINTRKPWRPPYEPPTPPTPPEVPPYTPPHTPPEVPPTPPTPPEIPQTPPEVPSTPPEVPQEKKIPKTGFMDQTAYLGIATVIAGICGVYVFKKKKED